MKTVREWFEELPEPYRSEAMICIEKQERYKESHWKCKKRSDAIYHGFNWERSDQKGDYWNDLYLHFVEKERQNEIYIDDETYIGSMETILEEPVYLGKGNHNINKLEELLEQYKEYCYQLRQINQNCKQIIKDLKS